MARLGFCGAVRARAGSHLQTFCGHIASRSERPFRRRISCGKTPRLADKVSPTASMPTVGAHALPTSGADRPAFSFGVIADVQWADLPNGTNFARTRRRHYRGSLHVLRAAVDWWNALIASDVPELDLNFVADLGDLIDGQNSRLDASHAAMGAALSELRRCAAPLLVHSPGNHELYNFERGKLPPSYRPVAGEEGFFGALRPAPGYRVIMLDGYAEGTLGWPAQDPRADAAHKLLARHNPNLDRGVAGPSRGHNNSKGSSRASGWFDGLDGPRRRWVPYNGALGQAQRARLEAELSSASAEGEIVLILSHVVLHPKARDAVDSVVVCLNTIAL